MPSIGQIIGEKVQALLKNSVKTNLEKLFPGKEFTEEDFIWEPSFSGLTHFEVGIRLTRAVAEELGLNTSEDCRKWPDGREYLSVPLPIDQNGQISIPKSLAKRDDWFILVKVITRTAFPKKGNGSRAFYTCCLTGDGKQLYQIDSQRDDGTRTHSVAYYKRYGQMSWCQLGTEENSVKIRPMNLVHLVRDKEHPEQIRIVVHRLMVLRKDKRSGWQYKLELSHLCQFTVEEQDPGDGHGLRIMPRDIREGLTGQFDWLTSAVRESYRVLTGTIELPLYADQFDPAVNQLFQAIFGEF